ncbi:MAG: inositol-3-phosphate synthase [Deltaproteobacteria bacterium]|nr:inositol-3-phosphate synthase [Deltaproteobacteria bacterium]
MSLNSNGYKSLLLLVAGAKGAIGSTLAAAVSMLRHQPESVLPYLTTAGKFSRLFPPQAVYLAGWDIADHPMTTAIRRHGVLPEAIWEPYRDEIDQVKIFSAPSVNQDRTAQVQQIILDIQSLKTRFPDAFPVFINLLPACDADPSHAPETLSQIYANTGLSEFPDLSYAIAAIASRIPVVNFTPNPLECPAVIQEAEKNGVCMAGCDGKTGQTYFKVVLASAFKARNLLVDGWYSLNILGNADGKNLMDPERAAGKLANKTHLLDDILGYPVGQKYGTPSHKVHIDYYPPRGDAKEAWDVIDFVGLFDLPMSIRINLQGRDSILAAPLVLDLARWMAALSMSGRKGLIPELGFYFKKPMGDCPPVSFQEQLNCLQLLEKIF